jgi:tRNA A37 threonylcarbamoyladenosine synthetase subunit TsaC/SUA5/YrdC
MFISKSYPVSKRRGIALENRAGVIGSIRKGEDRHEAVRLIKEGFPVGIFVRSVAVIALDGMDPNAVDKIYRLKSERRGDKPMATILPAKILAGLIDAERIPPELHEIFLDARELESRLGTLTSVRVPIRPQAASELPSGLAPQGDDGIYWLQSWVPDQSSPGGLLVKEFEQQGVKLPGVTSMNTSGEPEIVDQAEALNFSAAHGLALFLGDPQAGGSVRGSFPILEVGPAGIRVIRQGHFSAGLFQRLLDGAAVDESHARAAKYPLLQTDSLLSISSPYRLHDRLVALLDGVAS